jgi:predicted nucleic acid-binding protein
MRFSCASRAKHRLLTMLTDLHNDALIIAVMRAHGLTNLASADPDFDRVPGITRYGPS